MKKSAYIKFCLRGLSSFSCGPEPDYGFVLYEILLRFVLGGPRAASQAQRQRRLPYGPKRCEESVMCWHLGTVNQSSAGTVIEQMQKQISITVAPKSAGTGLPIVRGAVRIIQALCLTLSSCYPFFTSFILCSRGGITLSFVVGGHHPTSYLGRGPRFHGLTLLMESGIRNCSFLCSCCLSCLCAL